MNLINDKTKYWLYSVSRDQWKIISNNIKLNKLFITTFICKSILKNDIIIFYIKVEAIYVAFGQVLNDIEKNTDNIILYNDRQLDKYIIKLKDMNISNNLCKKNDFIDIIDDYNKLIKKMIKNNCLFVEINIKNLGLEIMKKIYDSNSKKPIIIEEEKVKVIKNNNIISNIKSNIPILLIVCSGLRKVLNKLKMSSNKVSSILDHYKFCVKCKIINNNSTELFMTLCKIDLSKIQLDTDHINALNAYDSLSCYPNDVKTEYIKIYSVLEDEIYKGDILIEYTTKFELIEDIIELKNNI